MAIDARNGLWRATALSLLIGLGAPQAALGQTTTGRAPAQQEDGASLAEELFDEAYDRALRLLGDPPAVEVADGPALRWRFFRGPDVEGALRIAEAHSEKVGGKIGYLVMNIRDRGVFEGVYNVRPDGQSLVGVFWAEESDPADPAVAGFIDLGEAPDLELGPSEGRVYFLTGDSYDGLVAQ